MFHSTSSICPDLIQLTDRDLPVVLRRVVYFPQRPVSHHQPTPGWGERMGFGGFLCRARLKIYHNIVSWNLVIVKCCYFYLWNKEIERGNDFLEIQPKLFPGNPTQMKQTRRVGISDETVYKGSRKKLGAKIFNLAAAFRKLCHPGILARFLKCIICPHPIFQLNYVNQYFPMGINNISTNTSVYYRLEWISQKFPNGRGSNPKVSLQIFGFLNGLLNSDIKGDYGGLQSILKKNTHPHTLISLKVSVWGKYLSKNLDFFLVFAFWIPMDWNKICPALLCRFCQCSRGRASLTIKLEI